MVAGCMAGLSKAYTSAHQLALGGIQVPDELAWLIFGLSERQMYMRTKKVLHGIPRPSTKVKRIPLVIVNEERMF